MNVALKCSPMHAQMAHACACLNSEEVALASSSVYCYITAPYTSLCIKLLSLLRESGLGTILQQRDHWNAISSHMTV